MANQTRIILDLNGVIMAGVNGLILKFCLGQILRGKMSPRTFAIIMRKAIRNTGDMTSRERAYIDAFVETKYYNKIPFLPGAVSVCNQLIDDYSSVHICTAGALSDTAKQGFRRRILENMVAVSEIYFIPPLGSKADYYRQVKNRFPDDKIIVVDDSMRHIKSAREIGLDTRYINARNGFRDLNAAFYGNPGK